jgi:hypothetical protein
MKQMTAKGKLQHRLRNVTFFHIVQRLQEEKLEKKKTVNAAGTCVDNPN